MLRPLLISFGTLSLVTGLAYPLLSTVAARTFFPEKASGSLIHVDGQIRGSRLIAQATEDPRYFWARSSTTPGFPTNARQSGGSTLAASNPAFTKAVDKRIALLRASDPDNPSPIPQDLVTASASGLDPHISLEAAEWQMPRIAKARGLDMSHIQAMVEKSLEGGSYAPSVVNVMSLNAQLDKKN